MALRNIFKQIRSELPWVERTRLIVGPMASRELVKDALIAAAQAPAVPSWCVGTLAELAAEILNEGKIPFRAALSTEDRVDALSMVARQPFFAETAPELATHLRDRAVAAKLARFLTGLDRFYTNAEELAAIAEYYRGRNPQPGLLVELVARLWERGELRPWSEGDVLRAATSGAAVKTRSGRKIFLWGFAEFTPLEELFLETLARENEVSLIVPQGMVAHFEDGARASGFRVNASAARLSDERVTLWSPHTPWDELGFLHDELSRVRAEGASWSEIAVFVPQDALYKRLARKRLLEWNVPIHDPTLPDAWMDRPDWIWWRDFLRAASGGLVVDDVRALVSGSSAGEKFARAAFATGASGGAAAMKRILSFARLKRDSSAGLKPDREDIPVLRALLETVAVFSRAMSPRALYGALTEFAPRLKELTGRDPSVLLDFATHLVSEREYLETFCARLSRYVPMFEEYLVRRSRAESPRHSGGLRFVAHGVLLPNPARHAIVLGANAISLARPSYDPWEWEGAEVRGVWERLHFGMPRFERMLRDEAFVEHALLAHENVVVSSVSYGLDGKPWSVGPLHARLREKAGRAPDRAGGHPSVGWVTLPAAAAKPEPVSRADLMARAREEGGLGSFENPELSVSKFEDYLKCPFLFYGRHVLKIEREDEPGLAPSALARGQVLHSVLERFLAAEIKGEPFSVDRTRAAALASAHVDAVVEKLLKDPRNAGTIPGLYAHGALVENTRHELLARVLGWHAWEAEYRAKHPSMRPFAVEMPLQVAIPLDGPGVLTLKGKADRVDIDGTHAVVIDYKSGGQPFGGKELLAGTGVQLLAYLRAIEMNQGLKPGGAFYLLVGKKVDSKNGVFLKSFNQSLYSVHVRTGGLTDRSFDAIFDTVFAVWREAATALLAGKFDPRPRRPRKDCPRCPFYGTCGYDYKVEADA
ncbi:MAG: PD-(D/E)XK nuclease family protein [Deltaproteobacteria bacterium]|nr:PD-(D/E)XK nuclease family protein [Deltaproteobacteria bacterium]